MATRFALFIFFRPVIPLFRLTLVSWCALACMAAQTAAQGAAAPQAGTRGPPGLPPLPKWSFSASAENSYGYKDNLLLSSSGEERSAFARGAVEAVLMRVPTGTFEYWVFAEAEGTHFFTGRAVQNETKIWIHSELGWRAGEDWKFSLPVTGYYNDHVLDQSDTEVARLAVETKVAGVMAGPVVRWNFRSAWWIETQATAQRKRYADESNDGQVADTALRLGWNCSERARIQLSGNRRWWGYDSRVQYSAAGRELFGTKLKIDEEEGEVSLNLKWGRGGRWQTVTRAGLRHYHDNGSGYWNYREQKVEHEVEWNSGAWLARLGAVARRVNFGVQTVGIGIDPPARLRDDFELALRLERKVTARWTMLGRFTWERSRSNERVASYVVNEGLLGVRWSWEK